MTKHLAVATAALALLLSLWVYDAVSQPDDGFVPGGGNNPGVGDQPGGDNQPGVGDDTPQITPVDVVIPNASFERGHRYAGALDDPHLRGHRRVQLGQYRLLQRQ